MTMEVLRVCKLDRENRSIKSLGLLLPLFALWIIGCSSPANVPPLEARVELANPRIEREFGSDVLKVDYKFTKGLPERGWQYQLQVIWPDGEISEIANYMNETQTSGTLDGEFSLFSGSNEKEELKLKLLLRLLNPDAAEYVPISNQVQIGYTPQ